MLFPTGTVGSGEVRGGAPATARDRRCSNPARTVARVDAVVLAGGSAFGLAAADGVMRYLAERGPGLPDRGRTGADRARPRASSTSSRRAAPPPGRRRRLRGRGRGGAATSRSRPAGSARARARRSASGAAASTRSPGGLGVARRRRSTACTRRRARGRERGRRRDRAPTARSLAGSTAPADVAGVPDAAPFEEERANTTLVVVVTDAALDKAACHLLAQSAHDGFARALRPGAHALRRRHRDRGRDRHAVDAGRRTSTGSASRPPTSSPTRFAWRPVARDR